jgi:hypothetical protein
VEQPPPEASADEIVERLVRVVSQLGDLELRRRYLVERLVPLPDSAVVEFLHQVQVRALRGEIESQAVVASGLDAAMLAAELGTLRVGRIYHEANRKKYFDVCNLFRALKPAKEPDGDEDAYYRYGLTGLTPGERASAARSQDADLLNRVGYDIDPRVIRQFLQNPRVTEEMVIAIAARRPNREVILREIYNSPKWRARPEVRVALVRNPYTPPQLALTLLPTLKKQELRGVLADGKVHREVRAAAEAALLTKKNAPEPDAD